MPTARIHSAYYVFGSARNSRSREAARPAAAKSGGRWHRLGIAECGARLRAGSIATAKPQRLGIAACELSVPAHRIRRRKHPVVFQCTLAAGPKCKKYGQPRPDSLWITQWICQALPLVRQLEPQLAACKCRPGTTHIAAERWALAHTWPSALPPSSLRARVNPTTSRPPTFRPQALNT